MKEMLIQCLLVLVTSAASFPISQPVYPNAQYITAQAAVPYRQPSAPGYTPQQQQYAPRPVYEPRPRDGLQNYASQPQQVQRIAPFDNSRIHQHIQGGLLASQAQEAFQSAQQRKAPVAQQTQVQPQQYTAREQPQQARYIARPVAAQYRVRQGQQGVDQKENEEEYPDTNPNYQFGFDVKDDLYTNYQNRKEQKDGDKIVGSYSVVDSDGFIRTVQYTADPKEGFKAEVTRQPTDIVVKIPKPDPQFQNVPVQRPQQVRYLQEPAQRAQQDQRQYQYQ
ncbi:hypothetical protein NQ315_001301 [Exocentrus adspersus]|uniref:Uncharacterized protein n=1 Tax=Exocentrus adspersus TaxID=1586481 RepID=A0AAV8WER5_9CUCU|nr:hypothetical protein NQ315_001301 [Exocentrus adspersus]